MCVAIFSRQSDHRIPNKALHPTAGAVGFSDFGLFMVLVSFVSRLTRLRVSLVVSLTIV